MTIVMWALAVTLMIVGFAGIVLPALPGTVLIFAGILVAAWADDFTRVHIWTVVLIGAIAVLSYAIDFAAAAVGVTKLGASRRAMVGATLGTLAGFLFGLPGVILGPFVGAVVGELTRDTGLRAAGRAGVAAWIGFAIGTAIKVSLGFVMLAIFIAALVV